MTTMATGSPPATLHIGIARNDRMLPLLTGDLKLEAHDLRFAEAAPSDIFWRALHGGEFDVTEMSLAAHAILTARGENPFVGLPVFTSRMFRHGSVFVRADAGIAVPGDLAGKRVGVPEYQMTAAVWMRGILQDRYGVAPRSVRWFTGGVNRPGRKERVALRLPEAYSITTIAPDVTLDRMLSAGEIDAIIAPQIPEAFKRGDGAVRRLFESPRREEEAYFAETGIFPIMHLLVVRRSRYEQDPGLARKLYDLFEQAKRRSLDRLYDADAVAVMLPWLVDEIEATRKLMGEDYWPYGIGANRHVLDAFVRHLREQNLIEAPLPIEALFANELTGT